MVWKRRCYGECIIEFVTAQTATGAELNYTQCHLNLTALPGSNKRTCCCNGRSSRHRAVSLTAAWNSLPAAVRDLSSSSSCLCSRLKYELSSRALGVGYGVNSPKHDRESFAIRMDEELKIHYFTYLFTYSLTIAYRVLVVQLSSQLFREVRYT